MKAFGVNTEAIVSVLEYSAEENFIYKEIANIPLNESKKIKLSVLINLKTDKKPVKGDLALHLVRIGDKKSIKESKGCQEVKRLTLWNTSTDELFDDSDEHGESRTTSNKLVIDQWEIRARIKLNFPEIPIVGPGEYAVALFAIDDENDKDSRQLLDCSYFSIS